MKQIKPSAINATIAELLEPLQAVVREKNRHQSLLGVWTPINGSVDWQPLDFLHDARGTVMLEDWMYEKYGYVLFTRQVKKFSMTEPCVTWVNVTWRAQAAPELYKEQAAPTRAEAVAYAFLRANGIFVEGGDAK